MLKLKYLFCSKDLAEMILENWEHDKNYEHFLEHYRISSNAVYWCKNQGQTFFLRFAPSEEKSREKIQAELDFLKYLRACGYNAAQNISSKFGRDLETISTPWGIYHAVAFKQVSGIQLGNIQLTKDIILGYGKALGKLHKLSSKYTAHGTLRNNSLETLIWCEKTLETFANEAEALEEVKILREYFSTFETSKSSYGLIHYDFEVDNVFFDDKTNVISAIDFDDSMYNFYALDIEQALDSLLNDTDCEIPSKTIEELFLYGYRTEYDISDEMIKLFPIFKRYVDLYGYVRILRSIEDKWSNEPEWLVNLRIRLNNLLLSRKSNFGKPV